LKLRPIRYHRDMTAKCRCSQLFHHQYDGRPR
jgi:hypothetical protein